MDYLERILQNIFNFFSLLKLNLIDHNDQTHDATLKQFL